MGDDDHEEEEDLSRRMEEAAALSAVYEQDFMTTIGNYDGEKDESNGLMEACRLAIMEGRSSKHAEEGGPWLIRISTNLVLVLELPKDYPSQSLPIPNFMQCKKEQDDLGNVVVVDMTTTPRMQSLIQELLEMATPGVEVAILWAEHLREQQQQQQQQLLETTTTLINDDLHSKNKQEKKAQPPMNRLMTAEKKQNDTVLSSSSPRHVPSFMSNNNNNKSSSMWLYVISSHHLLDHAPDNFLSKGGTKYKLNGWYRYGTPGLAFCMVNDCDGGAVVVESFMDGLSKKMPQKKFHIILSREINPNIITNGWKEVTSMDTIQSILTHDEFVSILNIQGVGKTKHSKNNSNNNDKGTKSKKNRKKK